MVYMTDTKPLNVREIGENGLQYRICWSEHIAAACRDRVASYIHPQIDPSLTENKTSV
jgi:hypothetical protein